jgi:hypothetical protein
MAQSFYQTAVNGLTTQDTVIMDNSYFFAGWKCLFGNEDAELEVCRFPRITIFFFRLLISVVVM